MKRSRRWPLSERIERRRVEIVARFARLGARCRLDDETRARAVEEASEGRRRLALRATWRAHAAKYRVTKSDFAAVRAACGVR